MSKHTPGPWSLTIYEPSLGYDACVGSKDAIVADVLSEADARLIAAAPRLLAALRAYVAADYEMRGSTAHAQAHNERLTTARVAIAEVEGR